MTDVIKQGKIPVFHFLCKLCNHEWNECYLDGSDMVTVEMKIHVFKAKMRCPCCGLDVWSDGRGKVKEEEESSTRCETCKKYESNSDITGWCSACPGTVIKGMNANNTCAAYEKREEEK